MDGMRVFTVDVFAQKKYTGNQLAVFVLESRIPDETMLALTRETNYSEATFLSPKPSNGMYDVRIFDPMREIPFAGHPVLGTAAVIREQLVADRPTELTLTTGVGQIPVWVEPSDRSTEDYWMQQVEPTFGPTLDTDLLARVLGLDRDDVSAEYPVQVVSTGLETVIVPLLSLDAVRQAALQPEPYYDELIADLGDVNLLVFAPETYESNDLNVRVFAESAGVPEDPATGSSNGCLAAYLVEQECFRTTDIDLTVEQGYEIDRPSLLKLRATRRDDGMDVRVGGQVFQVMQGRLNDGTVSATEPATCGIAGIRELMEWGEPTSDDILEEMEQRAVDEDFPTVGPEAGRTLALLVRITGASSVLELGSGFGYSAYWIARSMAADGAITLTDRDQSLLDEAKAYFERGGLAVTAKFVAGDALSFADSTTDTYDFIHVDHDTADYVTGFEAVRENLAADGVMVFDNVLVHDDILTPTGLLSTLRGHSAPNERTRYTAAFLSRVREDPAFDVTLLPVDEGIAVVTRSTV